MYREFAYHGGIPGDAFRAGLAQNGVLLRHRVEDVPKMTKEHPLFDDYWATKVADFRADRRAGLHRGELGGSGPAHPRDARGIQADFLEAQVARNPRPEKMGNFSQPENVERQRQLLRPLPQGHRQRCAVLAQGPSRNPRALLCRGVAGTRTNGRWRAQVQPAFPRCAQRLAASPRRIGRIAKIGYDSAVKRNPLPVGLSTGAGAVRLRFPRGHRTHRAHETSALGRGGRCRRHGHLHRHSEIRPDGNYVPFAAFSALEDGPVALGWLRAPIGSSTSGIRRPISPGCCTVERSSSSQACRCRSRSKYGLRARVRGG